MDKVRNGTAPTLAGERMVVIIVEKDLEDLMKDIADFCGKYNVNVEVETFTFTIGNVHKVRMNIKKGD